MFHRSLLILAASIAIIIPAGFFSSAASDNFCADAKLRAASIEHQMACFHSKVNKISNTQFAQLRKYYSKEFQINRNLETDRDLFIDMGHYSIDSSDMSILDEATIDHCNDKIKIAGQVFQNLTPQCLLSKMLHEYLILSNKVGISNDFLETQSDIILMSFESAVNIYSQYLLTYPVHLNYLDVQERLEIFIDELKKSSNLLEKIPNKFENATTTECQ